MILIPLWPFPILNRYTSHDDWCNDMKKNRTYLAALAVFLMMAAFHDGPAASKTAERILVLGFDTRLLNDIQDRLLRETIMRELQSAGFSIVPVMEIESLFHEDRKRQIRKLSRDEVRNICGDVRSGIALSGAITSEEKAVEQIIKGKNYICALIVFHRGTNRFEEIRITVPGEDNLYLFYSALSKRIVRGIGKHL